MRTPALDRPSLPLRIALLLSCLACPAMVSSAELPQAAHPGPASASSLSAGTLVPADQLSTLLPATVFFQDKTAPVQMRNAAAFKLTPDALVWMALVDTSGYASDVQEKYQFYLVTEAPLRFGSLTLAAGAYGAGFVGTRFVVMDLGGHTLGEGPVETDATLHRPRPLQVVPQANSAYRLYLGRRSVLLQPVTGSTAAR